MPPYHQAVTVICNFKKRHTSKKQMTETKKISRRELVKQRGTCFISFSFTFSSNNIFKFLRNNSWRKLCRTFGRRDLIELGKQQFETNFWGTVKRTKALLPYFWKQKQGKIITTGSFLGLIGHPNVSYYSASKHALEGYFKSLRFELNQFNIRVSMIEPVYFKTSLGNMQQYRPKKSQSTIHSGKG